MSAAQFSPDGRIFQVEYANKAVEASGLAIGIQNISIFIRNHLFHKLNFFRTAVGVICKDGVVLAVEKIVTSKLYEPGVNKRVFIIDQHIGMVTKKMKHTLKKINQT